MEDEKTFGSVRDSIKEVMSEVEKHNNVKTIFGEPVREKDMVIIPVAAISMRGGGGGGSGQGDGKTPGDFAGSSSKGRGSGLGVGYTRKVKPLGYIEIKGGQAAFKPIMDVGKIAMFAVAASILGAAMVASAVLKKRGAS